LRLASVTAIFFGQDPYAVANTSTIIYSSIAKYPLIAIPLFILTGLFLNAPGWPIGW